MNRCCAALVGLALTAVGLHGARADVYECVSPAGSVLFTDRGCPAGYRTRFVVREPQAETPAAPPPEPARAQRRAERTDAQRLADAEAEAALLREQLEVERQRRELAQERAEFAERQQLAGEEPTIGYSITGPLLVPGYPWRPDKPDWPHKPCIDCPPRDAKIEYTPRDRWRDCGMFGCPPSITPAPSDRGARQRESAAAPAPPPKKAPSSARSPALRAPPP
jgi:hypothetical protein